MLLAQSRTQTVVIGPVLDTDGLPVTTAAITNFSLAKNGTASAFTTETLAHLGNGYYSIALTTTNTNTLGIAAVFTNNTAWSMTVFRWNVIAASVYDAIVNNATNASGGLLTATGSVSAIAGALLNTGNLPSNFAALGINASGHVSRVTLVDTTTTNTDMRGTDGAALASNWTATRAGYLDGVLIAANYNQRTVQVTGSNHVAADIHELQAGVISSGDFAAGAITSTVLATDSITSSQIAASAVTEIQAGLATSSGVASAFTEIKGVTWSSSTDTLEAIRDASGSASVNIMPLSSTATQRVSGTTITTFFGDRSPITIAVFDSTGTAVNLTTQGDLEVVIERRDGVDLQVVANASITISGASSNQATFAPDATAVGSLGQHLWALRRTANEQVLAHGNFVVAVAAFDN